MGMSNQLSYTKKHLAEKWLCTFKTKLTTFIPPQSQSGERQLSIGHLWHNYNTPGEDR
ncbi:uncharacterized protein Nmag_0091 [Natrialba magadii ATCC 43099]|uniref:Uncharacterized protein n=1 Tax=Natrialba magadii (strain ATCC 43099 / DSM 3394 / CCM 3739 / CIP 104546 / IAM 13178 / JCM 8861 / NBRC 102185 / NCIMB 2190 / MS3) TaxID=547559 RepID=D3SVX1_NATMM|nr:uncharacterized protein Nmag_0091 [Natrialba magadii ATCC 43099]